VLHVSVHSNQGLKEEASEGGRSSKRGTRFFAEKRGATGAGMREGVNRPFWPGTWIAVDESQKRGDLSASGRPLNLPSKERSAGEAQLAAQSAR